MLILRGDLNADTGLVRVWQWSAHDEGAEVPEGWHLVDDVPAFPEPVRGINHVMHFNPETSEFSFTEEERALTPEEKKEKFDEELLAKIATLESKIDQLLSS
jgi:hypothetical protein